jgi:hypothetical protein
MTGNNFAETTILMRSHHLLYSGILLATIKSPFSRYKGSKEKSERKDLL